MTLRSVVALHPHLSIDWWVFAAKHEILTDGTSVPAPFRIIRLGCKMKFFGFLAITLLISSVSQVAADTNTCRVESIQGSSANVWRDGGMKRLSEAMALADDDRIVTGANTTVGILCSEEMRIAVGPSTTIDLGAISAEDTSWSAFLMDGVSWFARPLFGEDRFEVRTPSAVASVRSTEWFVEVADGATAVFVDDGKVAVAARQGGALLEAGLGIDVDANGVAGPVKEWGAKRVRGLRERLGFPVE